MMNETLVQLNQITQSFGTQTVLRGLDWTIPAGRVIGLLGRNGAGKSTLLECMLGLKTPQSGSATLLGESPAKLSDATRARIGYVPQQSDLFQWMSATQMLDYFRAFYPRWDAEKVASLLQRWQIDTGKTIASLSGGEKQRLSIIRALAHQPDLLVLDEPVASLDPIGRRDFLKELIETVVERHTTVIFSTHILSDLERVALDVAFLKDGKIALQTSLDELMESVRRVSGPVLQMAGLAVGTPLTPSVRQGDVTSQLVRLNPVETAQIAAIHGLMVTSVTLEDLFIEVTV